MNPTTMPPLGLGTWELTGSTCVDAVAAGIEMGYRHIDTAQMYGNEADVGEGIARTDIDRDQLWVTTKLDNHNHAPDKVIASTEDSLRRLGLDRVDLLLIHWPVELDELEETLEAMQELVDRDLVSNLGVSNFTSDQLRRAAEAARVVVDQVEYHALLDQSTLLETTREMGITLTAYSPLARGKLLKDPVVTNVAGARSAHPAQIALRWLLDQDGVAVIPKASSKDHLRSNLDVLDMQPLSTNDRAALDDLPKDQRVIDPPFGPDWD
ncbi:Methylglyoxal reductase, acetol producing [Euzebya pacifica]|uniref:Methylglyoxal reductase, acetol producing n=1 Tax=Euzebya pacifica TaxID=1608957 RepID=A0A346XUL9_9ACTN|nr:aldo/keto reductase [Euzebya pacifica]AXV05916.1 Methylglyoxal reductase, acetol producing [Euzebya pacifica]